jgi:uncharacterized protein YegP (UPF0339 family)
MASGLVLTKNAAAKFRFNLRADDNEIIPATARTDAAAAGPRCRAGAR